MALNFLYMVAAAIGGAGMLWHELQKHKEEQTAEQQQLPSKCKRKQRLPPAASSSTAAAIPEHELQQLQAFLHKVYRWRGWQGGAYHVTQAWYIAQTAAQTEAAGGWQCDFDLQQLTDNNCNAMLSVIDDAFFGGRLLKKLAAKQRRNQQQRDRHLACSQAVSKSSMTSSGCSCTSRGTAASSTSQASPADSSKSSPSGVHAGSMQSSSGTTLSSGSIMSSSADAKYGVSGGQRDSTTSSSKSGTVTCSVVQRYGPTGRWLACFDESNVIYINGWRWIKKHITLESPLNVEGVVCTSRLQMLLHTLAHELVHAVVFHVFPDMDKSSPAYLGNDRHGPIFHLLNKQLFGHSSDALERVQLLEAHH